jgi:hypothetical protein
LKDEDFKAGFAGIVAFAGALANGEGFWNGCWRKVVGADGEALSAGRGCGLLPEELLKVGALTGDALGEERGDVSSTRGGTRFGSGWLLPKYLAE